MPHTRRLAHRAPRYGQERMNATAGARQEDRNQLLPGFVCTVPFRPSPASALPAVALMLLNVTCPD
jgi:hypothetical protein